MKCIVIVESLVGLCLADDYVEIKLSPTALGLARLSLAKGCPELAPASHSPEFALGHLLARLARLATSH